MTEVVSCPACRKKLQVPEDFFGKTVQCPECKQSFHAEPTSAADSAPPPVPSTPVWEKPPPTSRAEEEEDRPRRRRRDADEDEDDRPRRRRLTPHRGGLILAFGIVALVMGALGLIFGPMAWVMGNTDLRAMRAGRMDPSGEGQTNTGRILGMVATLLHLFGLLIACGFIGLFMLLGIFGGAAAHRHH